MYLAGPPLVKMAHRPGGRRREPSAAPRCTAKLSAACLRLDLAVDEHRLRSGIGREIVGQLGLAAQGRPRSHRDSADAPLYDGRASCSGSPPSDMQASPSTCREVIARVVRRQPVPLSSSPTYGSSLVCAAGPRSYGYRIGILGNNGRPVSASRANKASSVHPAVQPVRTPRCSSSRTSPASWSARPPRKRRHHQERAPR